MKKLKTILFCVLMAVSAAVGIPVIAIGALCLYDAEPATRNFICAAIAALIEVVIIVLLLAGRGHKQKRRRKA